MPWLAVECVATAADVAALSDTLFEFGAVAVEWAPAAGAADVVEPLPGATPLWSHNRVCGLFALGATLAPLQTSLAGFGAIDVRFIEDDTWVDVWRRHAQPWRASERLLVAPTGHPIDADEAGVVVRLDPGLAFGSGSHPTTRLCLAWLARATLAGRALLDFGCGSGILAVAGRRLGATRIAAVDHDPQALLATRANAQYNDAPIEFIGLPGEFGACAPFDIVIANILANPLIELAPELTPRAVVGGQLVLSGLLEEQVDAVVRAYPSVRFAPAECMGGWALVAGTRDR
jgi:ribosomal protein L11 methyltransferase